VALTERFAEGTIVTLGEDMGQVNAR
jgi:hypothetical protein